MITSQMFSTPGYLASHKQLFAALVSLLLISYSLIAEVVGVSARYAVLAILNAAVKHKWAIVESCKLLSQKHPSTD